jgi:menaquinone reductase, molybdopterin-binding-like subunit
MDRRQFIKVTAATSASATLAGCGNPENHLIRFIPEEEIIPGIAAWKPSICPLCPSGCGILVRIMQGEAEVVRNGQTGLIKMGLAKKLEGNPAHPISQGKLCVRGQAAIQVTYHPDRITQPMKRSGNRGTGKFEPVTWDAAMSELVSKLDALSGAKNQKALAFLTRPTQGQRQVLIDQFLSKFGAPASQSFEVLGDAVLRRANARSFGREQLPTLDLAHSRYIVSFGADFLGTWNSVVAQNVAYGDMRQGVPGQRGKFVQVEPRMSQTGANADEWVAIKPGTEGVLALGLAHVIIAEKLRPANAAGRAGAQIDGWNGGLATFTPAEVEKRTGVAAARIERLGREFAAHGPAVAINGGAALAQTNGMFTALAVNALNALVGSVGQPGGILFTPGNTQKQASASMDKFAADILNAPASPIQVLLLSEANPVFGTPSAWRVKEALLKVPYIASFGSFLDETSSLSDLVLPDHSFLESWVDHVPESGTTKSVASVAAPAMKPIHETRAMPDVLLEVGRKLNPPLTPAFQWQTFDQMLQAGFGDNWAKAQEQGGIWSDSPVNAAPAAAAAAAKPVALEEPRFEGDENQYPFFFLPYASQAFLDGSVAHLPWLQELPDVLSTAMWSSWVEINPQTAAKMGIAQGELLEVASTRGTLRAPALLSPGIAPDIVAMPIGQGHETYTRFASGRGANPISILAPVTEPETGALAWAATRVKITKAGGTGQLTLFAGGMKEREVEHR